MSKLSWTNPQDFCNPVRLNSKDFKAVIFKKGANTWNLRTEVSGEETFASLQAAKNRAERVFRLASPLSYYKALVKGFTGWGCLNKNFFATGSVLPLLIDKAAEDLTASLLRQPFIIRYKMSVVDAAQLRSELESVISTLLSEVSSAGYDLEDTQPYIQYDCGLHHTDNNAEVTEIRVRAIVGVRSAPGTRTTAWCTLYIDKDKVVTLKKETE